MNYFKNISILRAIIFFLLLGLISAVVYDGKKKTQYKNQLMSLNNQVMILNDEISALKKSQIDFKRLKKLQIKNLTYLIDGKIFDRSSFMNPVPTTDSELYQVTINQFNKYKSQLKSLWKIDNDDLLLTLFFMNVTTRLWGFGNIENTKIAGCVFDNETHFPLPASTSSSKRYATYIKSNIGCCNDYADLLQFFLNKADLKNRRVNITGHVFNEVYIDGKWMAFDPSVNFWWHDSWYNIQNADEDTPVVVTIFPNDGTLAENSLYRPLSGQFMIYMLLGAAYKTSKDISYG